MQVKTLKLPIFFDIRINSKTQIMWKVVKIIILTGSKVTHEVIKFTAVAHKDVIHKNVIKKTAGFAIEAPAA